MLLKQIMDTLSTNVSDIIKELDTKTMSRFDTQDTNLKDSAQMQHVQMEHIRKAEQSSMRVRLLDALGYPEINERRNMIEGRIGNFGQTYKWIFSKSSDKRHEFLQWLQSDENLFWINGKPGSGKSSLMTYIYNCLRAGGPEFALLQKWAHPRQVKLLSFWFFRPASSHFLKSLEGFWRSLCFQILDMDIGLVEKIHEDDSAPPTLKSALIEKGSASRSWTNNELREWFFYAISKSDLGYCILVDGLDEIEKNSIREILLDTIHEISRSSERIKICCSCRPESPFHQTLKHYPSLKLQDLNHEDILEDCQRQLAGTLAVGFAHEIANRADGVFLWAHLAARELRAAARQGDNEDDLEQRLKETPDEMNEFFRTLLERQDKFYAKHPKPYLFILQVVTQQPMHLRPTGFTLFDMLLISRKHEILASDFTSNLENQYWLALEREAVRLKANVVASCAGLVEVITGKVPRGLPWDFPHKALGQVDKQPVRFIHRSVQDFLLEDNTAHSLLQSSGMSEDDVIFSWTAASSLRFIAEPRSSHMEISRLAQLIQPQPLRDKVARLIHRISPVVAARGRLRGLPTHSVYLFDVFKTFVSSIDLSPLENATIILLTGARLLTNVTSYIDDREPKQRQCGALVALLEAIQSPALVNRDFISGLERRIEKNAAFTICYESATSPRLLFSCSGNIQQHIFISTAHVWHSYSQRQPGMEDIDPEEQRRLIDSVHLLLDVSKEGDRCMDLWFVQEADSFGYVQIMPEPDEIPDALQAKLKPYSILHFKFKWDLPKPRKEPACVAECLRWSPPGFDVFLDISRHEAHVFEKFYWRKADGQVWQALVNQQAGILSRAIGIHSPLSVAQGVLALSFPFLDTPMHSAFIYDTQVRTATSDERRLWEDKLYKNRGYEHHDPITAEIIRLILEKRGG
ncbi:uncharacterized protein A1O9_06739 [Exophiala aquamarina CBS 119918]|uniref:NACHT domain-containing protein n=1 Tax=Exophiala aquamarina CBS 119918 TaxID=1182545 RepID=A0A072P9J9_9EURO|nr:uncharacterized protein A1O9_06739 [Exophiala aquamarina CBS 119918]KEF56551.1 hypothetical protein A1O9_06739 [Exophiala aquamarina CBS 119918]